MIENATILAAGMGRRMGKMTQKIPKCLIEVNGATILENMLKNLLEAEIKHCTIVIGYLGELIRKKFGNRYGNIEIEYLKNNQYETTNDMYSFWIARDTVKKGTLLIESDIFLKRGIIPEVLKNSGGRSFYLAGRHRDDRHNILLSTNSDGMIYKILDSNDIHPSQRKEYLISAGILLIQPDLGKKLVSWLDSYVMEGKLKVYYDSIIAQHIDEHPFFTYLIPGSSWVEIDTEDDLKLAEKLFQSI
jgi:choline kinase